MKTIFLVVLMSGAFAGIAQTDNRISTIDFVQIVNDNKEETIFYFENNWKALRDVAIKKEYIHSYQILETPFSQEAPFHLMLITTYGSKAQYDQREEHFNELIQSGPGLKLMNAKQPNEFRKTVFHKENVRHRK